MNALSSRNIVLIEVALVVLSMFSVWRISPTPSVVNWHFLAIFLMALAVGFNFYLWRWKRVSVNVMVTAQLPLFGGNLLVSALLLSFLLPEKVPYFTHMIGDFSSYVLIFFLYLITWGLLFTKLGMEPAVSKD